MDIRSYFSKTKPVKPKEENIEEKKPKLSKKINSSLDEDKKVKQESKEIPLGKDGCLSGKRFVITGQLSSITREDVTELIERCGGTITTGVVSAKTDYLIIGEEAAASKINKADSLGKPTLDEDQLFDCIRSFEKQSTSKSKKDSDVKPEPKKGSKITNTVTPEEEVPKPAKKFNYWAHKNAGPSNPGSKEVPLGREDCLLGKKFVITGQLSSITRDDTTNLIKRCGGSVTGAVSSKTDYLIIGEDPGESKIAKAKSLGTPTLDEDQFFDYVRSFENQPVPEIIDDSISKPESGKASKIKITIKPGSKSEKPITPKAEPIDIESVKLADLKVSSAKKPPPIIRSAPVQDVGSQMWVDKYKPTNLKQLCGNNTAINELHNWLRNWDPSGSDNSKIPRAVLISGPPGIGKTTSSHLACLAAGFKPVEFNASDTRSKKSITELLGGLVSNPAITQFFRPSSNPNAVLSDNKTALILDEVDGMSGGDRGGVAEIIKYIKKSKVPIICVCNDRMSPKVRSLANHCLDLKFRRPTAASIKPRIEMIAKEEGLVLSTNVIDKLVEMTHGDIRQIINLLTTWRLSNTSMSYDQSAEFSKQLQKNTILGPFNIVEKFCSSTAYQNHSLSERLDFYFHDFQIAPLMVQENYIRCVPQKAPRPTSDPRSVLKQLELLSEAADCISKADLVDRAIYSSQNWGLLPVHAAFSCAMPSFYMHGHANGQYMFPLWLGQNSKANKYSRLLKDTHLHMRSRMSGDKTELRQSYLPCLITKLTQPLVSRGQDGIAEVMDFMDYYYLEKDDWDSLIDLKISSKNTDDVLQSIPTAVKSAFTRAYNKASHPTIVYGKVQSGKSKGAGSSEPIIGMDEGLAPEDEAPEIEENEEVDSEDDKLIKKSKPSAKRKAPAAKGTTTKKPRATKKK